MKTITAEEFDKKFDDGEDISEYVDWENGFRPNQLRHVGLDLPAWLLFKVDGEAKRTGVTREYPIRSWIEEQLENARSS